MSKWEDLVERKIREAMKKGEFDNLPGKGKPLDLGEENPFEDPSMRTAYRLLRNNNFTLPWIEERKELESVIDRLRAELSRRWGGYREGQKVRRLSGATEDDWRQFLVAFRRQVADLNRRIAAYNLKTPSTAFQKLPLDADREINKVTGGE